MLNNVKNGKQWWGMQGAVGGHTGTSRNNDGSWGHLEDISEGHTKTWYTSTCIINKG